MYVETTVLEKKQFRPPLNNFLLSSYSGPTASPPPSPAITVSAARYLCLLFLPSVPQVELACPS